jgi:RNA polymerase sigma factor (sigma-70 family)
MLWGLSYRLTGCAADADDVVHETCTRALECPLLPNNPSYRPWLIRVATNLGLDVLRRRKRQPYAGVWLPSPIDTEGEAVHSDDADTSPGGRYEMLESVSFAFLLALEALSPRHRAVLILREVFEAQARDVAEALSISEENVRISHHRARRAMHEYDRHRCLPTRPLQDQTRRALQDLVRCLINQDAAGVEALLADSVRSLADGGGEYGALPGPLVGRDKVAELHLRVAQRRAPGARVQLRFLNGLPAMVIEYASAEGRDAPRAVLRCDLGRDGRIHHLHTVLASRKLTAVRFGLGHSL